jgi:hypothetical protein
MSAKLFDAYSFLLKVDFENITGRPTAEGIVSIIVYVFQNESLRNPFGMKCGFSEKMTNFHFNVGSSFFVII